MMKQPIDPLVGIYGAVQAAEERGWKAIPPPRRGWWVGCRAEGEAAKIKLVTCRTPGIPNYTW
jgi:hypothetical protein